MSPCAAAILKVTPCWTATIIKKNHCQCHRVDSMATPFKYSLLGHQQSLGHWDLLGSVDEVVSLSLSLSLGARWRNRSFRQWVFKRVFVESPRWLNGEPRNCGKRVPSGDFFFCQRRHFLGPVASLFHCTSAVNLFIFPFFLSLRERWFPCNL